ncbi:kinase-like domain-containing protein, partial [Roridomyces roridus]
QQASPITLQKFTMSLDPITLDPDTLKSANTLNALIYPAHFAKGSMKLVYDLIILLSDGSEERVAAKRLYRVVEEDADDITNMISLSDNHTNLESEVYRLILGEKVLNEFYAFARKNNVDVFHIKFSSAYLATEIRASVTREPSTASGMVVFPADSDEGMTWLIEPKRAAAVISFTGTLDQQPTGSDDICSNTIHAFAHYTFGASEATVVFADLQGTPGLVGGKDRIILFDPMTHTTDGTSGLGDFGDEGIDQFIEGHECNDICDALGLWEKYP